MDINTIKRMSIKQLFLGTSTVFLAVLTVAAIVITIVLVRSSRERYDYNNVISVSASSEVFATPDIAEVTFTLRSENKDVTIAQEEVDKQSNAILLALGEAGIKEEDMKTINYSSNPHYEWTRTKGNELVGFEVNQTIALTIRDLEKVGTVLQVLGNYDTFNMYGPNFRVEDTDEARAVATEQAIAKAKDQAEKRAKALGVKLGKILNYSEAGDGYYPMAREEMAMAIDTGGDFDSSVGMMVAPNLPVGQNKIISTVYITYKIR